MIPTNLSPKGSQPCPQRNLSPPNALPWEKEANIITQNTIEGSYIEQPYFGGDPPKLIFTFHLTLTEYITLKNEAKTAISESWAALAKLTFHLLDPLESSKWATTKASFAQAMPYKTGKASFRIKSPHHRSCHNLKLKPSPTLNLVWLENFPQPLLIFFITPHHEPPNLESTTTLHSASLSCP